MEPGVGNGTGEIRSNLAFILAAGPTVFAGMWGAGRVKVNPLVLV